MEKFVLPKRWVVKATTDEEDEIIVPYINQTFGTRISSGLSSSTTPWYYSNVNNKKNNSLKHDGASTQSFENCTEITLQQFEIGVLKTKKYTQDTELNQILIKLLTE